ncbi:MAG: hypothetical protein JST58_02995 [Bacteroidetes bacterium]|nr:hypothetical protein [Bacteroidota bacterium]
MNNQQSIGILAYGSLIDDPGPEISPKIKATIDCITPFNVEFARMSKTRDNAPTLIPVGEEGCPVKAKILVLENISESEATDMLWRRETRQTDRKKKYPAKSKPYTNDVVVKTVENFHGISIVLYTSIGQNIGVLTAGFLAKLAIESYYNPSGDKNLDGVHYLMNAKNNGIKTTLSPDYEKEILKATNTTTLSDALDVLAKEKPHVLQLRKQKNEFEKEYKEIGDLVHSYGLKKTLNGKEIAITDFKAFIEEHRSEFTINVHEGFKQGQEKILQLLLDFEKQKNTLESDKSNLKGKANRTEIQRTITKIRLLEYWEDLLRHMIDSIGWQMIHGQLYISRRLYQGVGGKKRLLDTNIESVAAVAKELNKVPEYFALITDLSGYFQVGDIMQISNGKLQLIEVKEGDKNHQVLEVMDKMLQSEKPTPEVFEGVDVDKHLIQQLDRTLKQLHTAIKVTEIINTDKGTDKQGRDVRIITPKEDTPRFDERMSKLEYQLKTRNFWAYDVVEECLHIGMYKGPMKLMGPGILKGIAKQGEFTYILANYRSIVRSLNRPVFSLPFSHELVYDILFDRVDLIFMIDLDSYLKLFEMFELTARWLSRKETAKVLEEHKGSQIFVYEHQCICIEDKEKTTTMYLSIGMLQKIYFEFILPSYTAYSSLYYLGIISEDNQDGQKANDSN